MRFLPIAFVLAALCAAAPVAAQERSPELRQTLLALARVLGESHALRQACNGSEDQHWRSRMTGLIDTEQPEAPLEKQLRDSFEAGLATGRKSFPDCSPASRHAEAEAAERGRALAGQLAAAQRRVPGWQPTLPGEETGGEEEVTPDTSPR
jgi:uncharacterized protein (TIGR02301 family)